MMRLNLILATLAVLLLSLLLWTDRPSPAPSSRTISTLDTGAVQRIALFAADSAAPRIVLEREGGDWHLHQPVTTRADAFRIAEILALPGFISQRRLPVAGSNLAALDLDPPLWRVEFDGERFDIGASEPVTGQRHVRHGEWLHLVEDFNPTPFDLNHADLADRRLLPPDARIVAMRLPDGRLAGDGAPLSGADAGLARRWTQAEAFWVGRPASADFESVRSRITLQLEDGASLDFLISATTPQLALIRPDLDLLYRLPGSARDELLPVNGQP